ncbi:serine-rich adhesin for platelets isoform X1 [Anastrepha ludens]|uniref:serine-rich adhesin for platelets isoform X1 n=1 Tax=Anastrepha ludens TaxID=28586 RepID=UPI0023AF5B58|nr:serine-rich adhesin for platelets isoform X1 [Anastrepha ludens]
MSVFTWKEDSIKTNLLMEEGDSSLEPGEVKTPPHGIETTKPKVAEEAIKMKCNTSHYLPHSKSASKQEIDKCAEKVRAILEIDAMKRKEELERRKEQKSEASLLKSTARKKDHKKHKIHKREPKNVNLDECKTEKIKDAVITKTKNKKSKHEEHNSYSRHPTAETCENLNNPTTYRSYNPFMRNYRTDFRHRGNNFVIHNRTRFSRYRSQYISGSFHAPAEEPNHSSPPHNNVPYSQLLWTKTKPSISYAFNLHEHDVVTYKRNSSEISVQKKKKYKKSKEREESNKSSPKSSRKSSKRKKIRKIRETLQPVKNQMISPSHESAVLTTDNRVYTSAVVNKATENSDCTPKNGDTPKQCSIILYESDKAISERLESKTEHSKLVDKASGNSARSQVLDMFASLTPPKHKSPPIDFKVTSNTSSNLQITNKLQEIQDRIDKLLEDDELKLEAIQATKDKLLQKSREHAENINLSKSSKLNKILSPSNNSLHLNIVKSHDKLIDTSFVSKSSFSAKSKDKSPLDIFSDTKKDIRKQYTKGEKELTATKTLHSKILHSTTPNVKQRNEKRSINTKVKSSKNKIFVLKKDSLEDSPSNLTNSTTCAMDGSPDTDDYSDNWENDDEELDMSSAFQNINQLELSKNTKNVHNIKSSPSSSLVDSVDSESNSKMQSTTPKNSPPQQRLSPKLSYTPRESPKANIDNQETDELQRLYNQFIKSVENANIKIEESNGNDTHIEIKTEKENEIENEALSASSASYSSSSSSTSDTSISSSGSSSTTSSSDSASDDSNDTDMLQNNVSHFACNDETAIETTNNDNNAPPDKEKTKQLLTPKEESKPNVVKDLKKLENLEANLLRIQMMRANYDSADEISDELLKMEKLFLHEKNIILNKFMGTSISKSEKKEKQDNELDTPIQSSIESLQTVSLSKGQFVQSMQKLQNKDDKNQVSNIFDTNREVIKLTISPVKLPKTSAIFEADNEMEITKQAIETCEKTNSAVKPSKPMKEVAIVKPIMETKEPPSAHHQKRRRSPLPTHHALQSRSRSRRERVRSLSVSPSRNNSGRCASPQRRGGFLKQSRSRNYERRSRSRSPSVIRPLSRRSGDISPNSRKRRTILNVDERSRKHSPRRDSRSRSRSPSSPHPRHRSDRYSRSPLPFKPPSPPTDPHLSPSNIQRSSLSPVRRLRSISRSPRKTTVSPSTKSRESDRHRSLSPKHRLYKQHSPHQSNTSYYFNHSPSRISLDARINIVLNGPSSSHNESNNITTYEDYSQYGQYGPATYMSLPSDSNSFYTNQYVPMANSGATVPQSNISQHTYSNLPTIGNDESELFSSMPHHVNVNATNFYYNRFGTQPFGLNQPSPLLKELPKATVAVQKGNVLEIVPCSDLLPNNIAEHTNENENHNKKGSSKQEDKEEAASSNSEKRKRSILKPLDEETNSLRNVFVGASKKKKVNFEDGVFPNHNSDEEDRKVIEAKIRVKMRRLRKKLGVAPPCHNLIEDKARKERQKADTDKKAPPPPPNGFAPPSLEQPIYLRTHTPTPLLYFHFDGVVHSMYVSQMERPIPPRLLNQKCLPSSNINVVSQHTDSQSPLYMQSPISAGAPHLHVSKKDPIATFTRLNRTENISPKAIPSTTALQQAAGSPKINYKMYSPIESIHHTEIGSSALPSTSPNSIKGNTIHIISSTAIANHFLPKRQESPKDPVSARTNMSMGLLPVPTTHPSMTQNSGVAQHTRIPVIGVPPTVIPKVGSSVSEQFMGGFASTMIQNCHQPINNQNYLVPPAVAHTNNPHMPGVVQQYFNTPVQRMHRPFQNFMAQQAQPSSIAPNLPMYHMVEPIETTNADLDKFANPQNMAVPYSYKGP